jgi:hypothetical protein
MRRAAVCLMALWAVGCSGRVEKDDRPAFAIDPEQAFRLEFGRGSGMRGLETVRITQDGRVALYRHQRSQPQQGGWESASLQLASGALAEVLKAVEANGLMALGRAYHDPDVADGTQWVFWVKQGEREKSVYFNNNFPRPITRFAEQLDSILSEAGLDEVAWQTVPDREAGLHHRELWNSIKR